MVYQQNERGRHREPRHAPATRHGGTRTDVARRNETGGWSAAPRLRVVPAPGGFAFVRDEPVTQ